MDSYLKRMFVGIDHLYRERHQNIYINKDLLKIQKFNYLDNKELLSHMNEYGLVISFIKITLHLNRISN